MKLYDIVFSPTGGTKKVADYLINALEGDITTVDLTDSKQNFHAVSLTKEDVAVISVPSYGGRVPAVAVERLGMVHGNGARAVLVCVYGNRAYEDTLVETGGCRKAGWFSGDCSSWPPLRNIPLPVSLPPVVLMRWIRQSFAILPNRFSTSSPRRTLQNPCFPGIVLIRKREVPVWCPKQQKIAPTVVSAHQSALCRPSTRTIQRKWTKRRASPVCVVSLYARRGLASSIPSCSLRQA